MAVLHINPDSSALVHDRSLCGTLSADTRARLGGGRVRQV